MKGDMPSLEVLVLQCFGILNNCMVRTCLHACMINHKLVHMCAPFWRLSICVACENGRSRAIAKDLLAPLWLGDS